MKTKDFYYDLPDDLIAQHPEKKRDCSRLMVLDGNSGQIQHKHFSDLPDFLQKGDCLVVNNTRVIPARLLGSLQKNGGPAEILLLNRKEKDVWETLVRPGKKLREGSKVDFIPGVLCAEILSVLESGNRLVRFFYDGVWEEVLDRAGTMPLPPYIREKLSDARRYQTVYAKEPGSAAAPTAGLHFTEDLLCAVRQKGVSIAEITLHVGLGTFRPVKVEDVNSHQMHSEWYSFSDLAADTIRSCKEKGGRIIAVGTTSCRTLETIAQKSPDITPSSGWTDIFIYPGYEFLLTDTLITNFHLPESTLLMLVSAFSGKENIFRAYETAVQEKYRFFSFGDAMLLTKKGEKNHV